jgi:cytochrome c oxidase subunit 1
MQVAQQPELEVNERPLLDFPKDRFIAGERFLIGSHIIVAFAALFLGILLGPFQTFRRAPALQWEIPVFSYYYQALTAHGVLNALVFTTFFIMGVSYFVVQRSLERPLKSLLLGWVSFWVMLVGMVLAAGAIISGTATVLFTFYPPMVAHWTFYLGLTLVIVGSWIGSLNVAMTYNAWRADHPGEPVPLATYAVVANFLMWFTATLGVAIEVLTMLLPLSLGWVDTTDPQIARIFFWFFGHPLVYFWLIPAYISWYTMLPRQLGVRLFSDTMARIAFLMIAVFSIPIGVHHLFADPGVSEIAKMYHSLLTFVVAAPSLLTAFNVAATLERGGRKNGAEGNLFGLDWIWNLPWDNPVIVAQLTGMLLFIFGGVSGIMNASYNLNTALHNTTWVVGHFHTTLGGAVFLTYVSIAYWMIPKIRGRKLWQPRLALAQAYLWFVGMAIFAGAMGRAGLAGATRRTDTGAANAYVSELVGSWLNLSAIAGGILLISSILLYAVIIGTLFFSDEVEDDQIPVDTYVPEDEHGPMFLENWRLWVTVIVISNVIMWGPVLYEAYSVTESFWTPGAPWIAR